MKQYKFITVFSVSLLALAGFQFMNAAWTAPVGSPPAGNISAPINVGTSTESIQGIQGSLTSDILSAVKQVWSDSYCDAVGENCKSATSSNNVSIGVGQTWENVKASRAIGQIYTNTTGRPIMVSVFISGGNTTHDIRLTVGGVVVSRQYNNPDNSSFGATLTAIVPPDATYTVGITLGDGIVNSWAELR